MNSWAEYILAGGTEYGVRGTTWGRHQGLVGRLEGVDDSLLFGFVQG